MSDSTDKVKKGSMFFVTSFPLVGERLENSNADFEKKLKSGLKGHLGSKMRGTYILYRIKSPHVDWYYFNHSFFNGYIIQDAALHKTLSVTDTTIEKGEFSEF